VFFKKKKQKQTVSGGYYVCGVLFPPGLGPVVELCFLLAFRAMELAFIYFLLLFVLLSSWQKLHIQNFKPP